MRDGIIPDGCERVTATDQYGGIVTAYLKPNGNVVLLDVTRDQKINFTVVYSSPNYPQQKRSTSRASVVSAALEPPHEAP